MSADEKRKLLAVVRATPRRRVRRTQTQTVDAQNQRALDALGAFIGAARAHGFLPPRGRRG